MKVLFGKFLGVIFDVRVVVGMFGVLLSVIAHEFFHVAMHWYDIERIGVFPDRNTVMQVVFTPSHSYDLVAEEAVAYAITMVVLLLTAKLIAEIHDTRDTQSAGGYVLTTKFRGMYGAADDRVALEHLSILLGVTSPNP